MKRLAMAILFVLSVVILPMAGLAAVEIQPAGSPEFRQPQLASAYGQVALTYGAGSTIWFSSSPDGGRTFSPRVKVADSGALALGRHRGPRLTILPDAILITAVVGQDVSKAEHAHGLPDQGDLTVWRSVDRGKTWVRTGIINDTHGASSEGLHAIAADSKGNLFAAWLDLRTKGTQLYGARSTDGGRTWSKNVLIYASADGTICQCCDPSIAMDAHGQINVMWRNALAGSRDLYLTHSTDGQHFSVAEKLGNGTWKLDACPMDGGGIAIDHGQIVTAWRRGTEIFLDRPGAPEARVAEGKDVAIAATARGTYVIWSDANGIEALSPNAKSPVKVGDDGGFPALTALPDGSALAAWEEKGAIRIEKLQ
jgi:hypothetical protein